MHQNFACFTGAHVDPITMTDMKLRKWDVRKSRAHCSPPAPAALNPDAVSQLRFRLLNATKESGYEVPAVYALATDRFKSGVGHSVLSYAAVTNLPDVADALSPELAYCCEIEVSNYPLPVAFLQHKLFDSTKCVGYEEEKQRFIDSVVYSSAERMKISEITEGKSKNLEWYNQRMGSLTASNFGPVLRFMSSGRTKPDGLIRRIQNYRQRGLRSVPVTNVPPLRWGLKCESVAVKSYQSVIKCHHKDLVIQAPGLCVSDTDPYLRASPDGIISCRCHPEQWLLEIKCPWTARNIDPADAIDAGVIRYVRKAHNSYSLIPGAPSGYYEQVQGTMAIMCLTHCDFVIWTLRGVLVIPVKFDAQFWEQSKSKLRIFFEKYVVAEILTERVWRALPLFDTDAADDDDEPGTSQCDADVQAVFADVVVAAADDDDELGTRYCDVEYVQDFDEGTVLQHSINDNDECRDMQLMFFDISDFEEEETV